MNSSRRPLSTALIAAAAAWLFLFGAIQWGLRTPGREVLGVSSRPVTLDYSAFSGFLSPLSAEYIARILGLDLGPEFSGAGGLRNTRTRTSGLGSTGRLDITHPFTNDHFQNAYQIPSVPFTARTDASGATREPGEPIDCSPAGGTVWYRFRPANDVGLIANTIGTEYTTALAVFTGDRLGNLNAVRCDRDAQGNALTTFPAKAGTDYYFQITGPAGTGPMVFNLSPLGSTSMISWGTSGQVWSSLMPSITPDGRHAAFYSTEDCDEPPLPAYTYGEDAGDVESICVGGAFVRDLSTGRTTRVSVSSSGEPGNRSVQSDYPPAISADGRFVAFSSYADNLVPGDSNNFGDVFVHDRLTGKTERVSVSSSGEEGRPPQNTRCTTIVGSRPLSPCQIPVRTSISDDGRYVAFDAQFPNLHKDDRNGSGWDVFVRDRLRGTTELISSSASRGRVPALSPDGRYIAYTILAPSNLGEMVVVRDRLTGREEPVSVSSSGEAPNREAWDMVPSISADGRYVAFYSEASNLVPGDTNGIGDFFMRDRVRQQTRRVSVSSRGEQQDEEVNDGFYYPWFRRISMSRDGRFVAFTSEASNLVPRDTNRVADAFLHDLSLRTTTRVSVSSSGREGNDQSYVPFLSSGGHIVFTSLATNLTPEADGDCQDCSLVYLHKFPIF